MSTESKGKIIQFPGGLNDIKINPEIYDAEKENPIFEPVSLNDSFEKIKKYFKVYRVVAADEKTRDMHVCRFHFTQGPPFIVGDMLTYPYLDVNIFKKSISYDDGTVNILFADVTSFDVDEDKIRVSQDSCGRKVELEISQEPHAVVIQNIFTHRIIQEPEIEAEIVKSGIKLFAMDLQGLQSQN